MKIPVVEFGVCPQISPNLRSLSPNSPNICVNTYVFRSACARIPAVTKVSGFNPALMFRALADTTRLRILNLMAEREVCVCYFVEILGISQPKVSRHLAYLRRAGLVAARRDGKWIHYRLAEPGNATARRMLGEFREWLRADSNMVRERERLDGICCGLKTSRRLSHAPIPVLVRLEGIHAPASNN